MARKVVAIVGSYRPGGTVDSVVEAILDGAREKGAETRTFYLRDEHIEFCTNCRSCTQEPGETRGECLQKDAMEDILAAVDDADALVLASPVNFWNVTAVYRRFLERLLRYAYWPWGQAAPKQRSNRITRKAALVATSAAPGFCIPVLTGAARVLRQTAKLLGARPVGKMWLGLSSMKPHQDLTKRTIERARRIGLRLV
jgi:NAD(P)H-dependent FMN reductase